MRRIHNVIVLVLLLMAGNKVLATPAASGWTEKVTSPDGQLVVTVNNNQGALTYDVSYGGRQALTASRLGLMTSYGDFTQGLRLVEAKSQQGVVKEYDMTRTKASHFRYVSNQMDLICENADSNRMTVTFCVADNSVAFRYSLAKPKKGNPLGIYVKNETSSFRFPETTTTFLTPQSGVRWGFAATKPSYEEEYEADAPINKKSKFGFGYTFPALFKVEAPGNASSLQQDALWVLVSETGTTGNYCGCRLSDYAPESGYTVAFPMEGENNGIGSVSPAFGLPGSTPWRTIVVGETLKPIVESTVQFDVVEPLYEARYDYNPGRYTWSWILWGDASMNYDDQVRFIDLASEMGYEYILVDAHWNENIGYKRMEEMANYARRKKVELLLWYNSNGGANDAPQGPRGVMNDPILRKRDMAWMQRIGVKGIKVDFFGGDKQETLRLYEQVLSDANDYGLQVIFHGCTIPRGWERMYPNYVASEAALASENIHFTDYHARKEGYEMSMYPYTRNAVGSFDWGGVFFNKMLSRNNHSGHPRYTSEAFEFATAITNQTSVNCVAIMPNNLTDVDKPTAWSETQFIDGYPGQYAIMARKALDGKWYVGGINGTDKPITKKFSLKMLAGQTVKCCMDKPKQKDAVRCESEVKHIKVGKDGMLKLTLQPMGGFYICQQP